MTIDKNQLAQAKEWAEAAEFYRGLTDNARSAAEIVRDLPDEIVDGDRLREEADRMDVGAANSMKPGHNAFSRGYAAAMKECAEHVRALIPAPAPTVNIALGAWAMHPEHGKVLILSEHIDRDGEVCITWEGLESFHSEIGRWVPAADLSPVPSATPTEQDAPTPGTSPGGILHHPSSEHSADQEPQAKDVPGGEPWEVSVGNGQEYVGIRSETGIWELFDREDGHHSRWGLPGDITLITRMVPEQQPRVLSTLSDYENAPTGTIVAQAGASPYVLTRNGMWGNRHRHEMNHPQASEESRTVLRWGGGEQA